MSSIPTLAGINSDLIQTERLKIHTLRCGPNEGQAVIFIHGNCSSATYWEETMLALPEGYQAIAPDLRGYGDTDPLPISAANGVDDMAADVLSLLKTLGLKQYYVVGHSMGGGVVMKLMLADSANILGVTLVNPIPPYGYGGSKGPNGDLCYADGAPTGVNPEFVELVANKERGAENPMAPLNVMRQFYFKPPFIPAREEALLSSLLSTKVGDDWYPGDSVASENWPGSAPGTRGVLNALSCKYFDASDIINLQHKPPVLWIRGADDLIVSDNAMFDLATLGALGAVPGWPGADECPPQPMLEQTRAVLKKYKANGGLYQEEVIADAGHTPYIEKPAQFNSLLHSFIKRK